MNKNFDFRILVIDPNYVQMLPSHVQMLPHIGVDLDQFDFFISNLYRC